MRLGEANDGEDIESDCDDPVNGQCGYKQNKTYSGVGAADLSSEPGIIGPNENDLCDKKKLKEGEDIQKLTSSRGGKNTKEKSWGQRNAEGHGKSGMKYNKATLVRWL